MARRFKDDTDADPRVEIAGEILESEMGLELRKRKDKMRRLLSKMLEEEVMWPPRRGMMNFRPNQKKEVNLMCPYAIMSNATIYHSHLLLLVPKRMKESKFNKEIVGRLTGLHLEA